MNLTAAAAFIYTVLLKPAPIRWVVNKILLLIIPNSLTLPEGILFLNRLDPVISGALFWGVYEPYQLSVFREYVKPGTVVLDIGANIGLYTVIAGYRTGESGRVFAFEPESSNFTLLQKNIEENKLSNVVALERAVSNTNGEAKFFLSEDNKGNHSTFPLKGLTEGASVRMVSIDAWLPTEIKKVDVVKIDIQGAEPYALRGMEALLQRDHPVIFLEYEPFLLRSSGSDPIALLQFLHDYGYALYEVDESRKVLQPIHNIAVFTDGLKGEAYTNLIAI